MALHVLQRLIGAGAQSASATGQAVSPAMSADTSADIRRIWQRIEAYTRATGKPLFIRDCRHVGGTLTFLCHRPHVSITLADIERAARNMPPHVGVARVRVIRAVNGAILLEVPAPRARMFLASDALMAQAGMRVSLGPLTGARGQAIIDFDNPATAHVLIVAATGGGKTTLEHTLLWRLAQQNPPDTLRFLIIDPKNAVSPALDVSAHLLHPIARADKPGAIDIMRWLAGEIARRERSGQSTPRIVVVIDEMIGLVRSGMFTEALAEAVTKGRALGIHVVAATQYATRELLGMGIIKENFTARIVGRTLSAQSSNYATGEAGYECHTLHGAGDFVTIPGRQRFQCAYVTDDMLRALPRASAPARLSFAPADTDRPATHAAPAGDGGAPQDARAERIIDFVSWQSRARRTRDEQVRETAARIADILRANPGMTLDSASRNQWQRWLWPNDASVGGQKGQWVSEALALLRAEQRSSDQTGTETGTHG